MKTLIYALALFAISCPNPAHAAEREVPTTGHFYIERNGEIEKRSYAELNQINPDNDGMPSPYVISDKEGRLHYKMPASRGGRGGFDIVIEDSKQRILRDRYDVMRAVEAQKAAERAAKIPKVPTSGKFYYKLHGEVLMRDFAELAAEKNYVSDGMPSPYVIGDEQGRLRYVSPAAYRGDKTSFDIEIDLPNQEALRDAYHFSRAEVPRQGSFLVEKDGIVLKGNFADIAQGKRATDGTIVKRPDGHLHLVTPATEPGKEASDLLINPLLQAKLNEKYALQQAEAARGEMLRLARNAVPRTGLFYVERNGRILERDFAEIYNPKDRWIGAPEEKVYRDADGVLHFSSFQTGRGTVDIPMDSRNQSALRTKYLKQRVADQARMPACPVKYAELPPAKVF